MPILTVGLTHREAPLELRERLAIPRERLGLAVERLDEFVPEGVILSTCNRTEVYASVGHEGSGARSVHRFLAELSGLDERQLAPHLRTHWQEEAARHLFRVAAGLDSMILGEGQVLGQVREAFEQATLRRPIGPELARLFHRALAVGKRARSETAIARSAVSISQAAVERARRVLGGLERSTVLIIGAGKMGELAARSLREHGAERLLLMNRGADRADALAERHGGQAWPLSELAGALRSADIVIASTAAPSYLLTPALVGAALPERGGRPLVVVDIGVPRNVDPAVGELPGVELSNVDDLRDDCAANLELRRGESAKVEAIVEDELTKYVQWWQSREVAPTISALVQKAEVIRREELSRALNRLGPLSDREQNALNALTVAIVNKLLHAPITRLKERGAGLDGKHYVHAARDLFDLPLAELAAD